MEGVTTAIVGFIFVCIIYPRLVRNHPQFYTAFALVVLMLFFTSIARMINSEKFWTFVGGLNGLLQVSALVLLVLSTGGLSLRELTGEFRNAFEVIRRGESEKEVIVPLTGEMPKPRRREVDLDEPMATADTIHVSPDGPPPPPAAPAKRPEDEGRIPLE
jgi:hypothetical protein